MYAVIRIRGGAGTSRKILDTLDMLNLKRKFNCTLVPENESYKGMLRKVQNFVTWGEVDEDTMELLLDRRGSGAEGQDFDTEKVVKGLKGGETLNELGLKRRMRLTPPSGGFKKSVKKIYPGGEAGYRGDKINELLKKMI